MSLRNCTVKGNEHPPLSPGKYVSIETKDTGMGIPDKYLPYIFDLFYTTKPKGHGLRLATSYSIVKKHDGCIDVISSPGDGTVFTIYLPAKDRNISDSASRSEQVHRGSGHFLVMDDDPIIREILHRMLESFGYEVSEADCGSEALRIFRHAADSNISFSGIILDLAIPGGMGGKETAEKIRESDRTVPLFVASGYSEDPVMAAPEEYGFTASIRKPFVRRSLAEFLNSHIHIGNNR